jgi:hypothetical protein
MAEDSIPEVQFDHFKVFLTLLVGSAVGAFLIYAWNKTAGPWLTQAIMPSAVGAPPTGVVGAPGVAVNTP